jgi:hypothetical protein
MKKMKYGILALLACSTMTLTGCFNLDEEPFSEITEESFVPSEQDVAALMAPAYSNLRYIFQWQGYFDTQEEPGDIIITPTRPNGWDDGGTYRRMHQHKWNSEQWQPWNCYLTPYYGINSANRVKDQIDRDELPVGDLKESILAELRAIRALWYSMLLDTHGNVPIVTAFTDEIPTQSTRKELYDFVVKELTESLPNLSAENSATTYGRMNKWAALATLCRVYLNAEVYTGTAQWAKALDCANQIINSGLFELSADFADNFKASVDYTNKEAIFAIPYDMSYGSFQQQHKWYPPGSQNVFGNLKNYFWGGSCANPQFINAYEPGDKRLEKTWMMGPQYHFQTGAELYNCVNKLPSLTCFDSEGKNHTSVNWGYRVYKYEPDAATINGEWSNDFLYFRYAEILLTKAECLMRLGQNKDEAARLVSQIRARVFDDAAQATVTVADLEADTRIQYGTLDWDGNIDEAGDQTPVYLGGIYDEWGFEFACEAQRRTQMIRFGTFTTKNWFNHTPQGAHVTIFPIPLEELQANGNLKQNPGY